MMHNILTDIIFLPLLVAVVMGVIRAPFKVLKAGAFFSSVVTLFLVLWVAYHFDPHGGMQFIQHAPWIKMIS
jgi:hypothetical protein